MVRISRRSLVITGAMTAVAAAVVWYAAPDVLPDAGEGLAPVTIGGPFTLVDQDGKTVSDAAFRGRLMLVFFGFTSCPDICPTGLADLSAALDELGPDADKVAFLFVTVDPARDTVAKIKEYVPQFSPRLVGLTGTTEQTAAVAKAYRVYVKLNNENDKTDYTVDHSGFTYLMGKDGEYVAVFSPGKTPDEIAAGIRKALAA